MEYTMTLDQANNVWKYIDMQLIPRKDGDGYDLVDLQLHEVRDEHVPLDPMFFDTAEVIWEDTGYCWAALSMKVGIDLPECRCHFCTGEGEEQC
jgi:hypothetical protein